MRVDVLPFFFWSSVFFSPFHCGTDLMLANGEAERFLPFFFFPFVVDDVRQLVRIRVFSPPHVVVIDVVSEKTRVPLSFFFPVFPYRTQTQQMKISPHLPFFFLSPGWGR